MESDVEGGYDQPIFDRKPDFTNSIGTNFWNIREFDELLEKIPIDVSIVYSEHTDEEGELLWGYCIIESNTVQFETMNSNDIKEILETTLAESIERGFVEAEFDPDEA